MRGEAGREMRRYNRSSVLTALYHEGPSSRVELSDATGLSCSVVSRVVTELLSNRVIRTVGAADSRGGRPRILVEVNPDYGSVVGVDVTEDNVQIGLYDFALRQQAVSHFRAPGSLSDLGALSQRIIAGLRSVERAAKTTRGAIIGAGVAVPGPIGVPAGAELATELAGRSGLRIVLGDNRVRSLARAEGWLGAAGKAGRTAVVVLEAEAHVVLIEDRRIEWSGDWGHTTLVYDGRPCRCGARGCAETYIGADGVLERHRQLSGGTPKPGSKAGRRLLTAPHPELARETVGYLGASIAGMTNLLQPERVVLTGWFGRALSERHLDELRENLAERALGPTTIEAGLATAATARIGAAALPICAFLEYGQDPRKVIPLEDGRPAGFPYAVP
ncbi:hypothetical protein DMC61_37950 [Amycolatopsis sp. WAC 04169]|uniref:ROK family transcriptional regulator n=1 Tax=Amycolatopsis sp. WAC 04169 TaxID=2203197 RepID=UPI000F7882B0|nr:ROK family protein [Amycolatopsis sp. WAC 04169]RSN20600.1 hypothetical protein DMC61_37950 [Amycolatopsis sp. WAC 04169]